MEIVKPIFAMIGGKFVIQDLLSLKLAPADGYGDDFYKVKRDIFLGSGFVGGLPNFGLITEVMGQSIVPVVANVPGENFLRCLGTGFFISCSGILATAAHVIADPIDREYGVPIQMTERKIYLKGIKMGVMLPVNSAFHGIKCYVYRAIEWSMFLAESRENPLPIKNIDLKLSADIAICKIESSPDGHPYQPLSIVQKGMKGIGLTVGKKARAIGYGDMRDVDLSPAGPKTMAGDFRFDLFVSHGAILQRFPDNFTSKEASAPGPCFSAEMKLPGGMSGSPIFDDEGIYVHGVVSRGLEDESGLASYGYGCMLAPSLMLPLDVFEGRSVFDLLASGDHGITRITAPDI